MFNLDQNELKLVSLKEFNLLDLVGVPRAGPAHLRKQKGIDPNFFASGGVFVDQVLGYAIAREEVLSRIAQVKEQPPFGHVPPRHYNNWTAEVETDDSADRSDRESRGKNGGADAGKNDGNGAKGSAPFGKTASENVANAGNAVPLSEPPWYLEGQIWPSERGAGVTVAVLDYGVMKHVQLRHRDDGSDFCSCEGPGTPRQDISLNYHGTRCAGVVAAFDPNAPETQISPAPDCDLLSACVMRKQKENGISRITISQSDVLLMLSWAIQMKARVINMSFSFKRLPDEEMKLLEDAVGNIREQNLALVFAAAKQDGNEVSQPACIENVVGVGEYLNPGTKLQAMTGNGPSWNKGELLFGPGNKVETVLIPSIPEFFQEPSAACAYVSGVAALYVQRYWDKENGNVGSILGKIFADAKNLTNTPGGTPRLAVQLPKPPDEDPAGVPAPASSAAPPIHPRLSPAAMMSSSDGSTRNAAPASGV